MLNLLVELVIQLQGFLLLVAAFALVMFVLFFIFPRLYWKWQSKRQIKKWRRKAKHNEKLKRLEEHKKDLMEKMKKHMTPNEKRRQTMLQRYGVEYAFQLKNEPHPYDDGYDPWDDAWEEDEEKDEG